MSIYQEIAEGQFVEVKQVVEEAKQKEVETFCNKTIPITQESEEDLDGSN